MGLPVRAGCGRWLVAWVGGWVGGWENKFLEYCTAMSASFVMAAVHSFGTMSSFTKEKGEYYIVYNVC